MTRKKRSAFFRPAGLMPAIAPLWLVLTVTDVSVRGQMSNAISNASTNPSSADWTEFMRDNMQRWNPYETVLSVNNVDRLQVKWKDEFYLGGLIVESSPAVASGMVYIFSEDGNLYALNASTGAKLWSYATGSAGLSSPAVANGVVYFGSGNGNVYALNATTGALIWKYGTGFNVDQSPVVANGVVYVGSDVGNLYALNASTGATLWIYSTENGVAAGSPALANGIVYFGSSDSNLYALNATTGIKLWSYTTRNQIISTPAVANGTVYFGSEDSTVYALNANTGAKLWSYLTGGQARSSPAVANGVIYIGSTDGNLYALNASSGAKLWSYATGSQVWSSPAVANGVVYFSSTDTTYNGVGNLYALNISNGAKLWSYAVGSTSSSPGIVNGVAYLFGGEKFYAFAPSSTLSADLFLRIWPSTTTIHQGDVLTFAFPVWNLGPNNADFEVLNTQIPAGATFDYIRISGTPGLGTCTHPPYGGTGQIVCHENAAMAPNTTWTVRLTVKVTAAAGATITTNAATMSDMPDSNMANNTATLSLKVQ